MPRLDSEKLDEGDRSDDGIGNDPGVLLEFGDRVGSLRAVDSVHSTGVEPQGPQALLQFSDVVASHHRHLSLQDPVTQPESCLYQRRPSLRSTDAVNPKPAMVLEGF